MQLYDIKEDKGYPEPEIVPDELGDYYLAEEVDKQIAALNALVLRADSERSDSNREIRRMDGVVAELFTENSVLREQNSAMSASLAKLRPEVERLTKGLRNVLYQGHNDECLFCGFKDKIAQETLKKAEGGDAQYGYNVHGEVVPSISRKYKEQTEGGKESDAAWKVGLLIHNNDMQKRVTKQTEGGGT